MNKPGGGWRKWVATFGGTGLLPKMPGTWASAAMTLLLGISYYAIAPQAGNWNLILIAGTVVFGALCVALGRWAIAYFGREDPGPMVLDEAAAICLTMLFQPMRAEWHEWIALAAGFAAFRIFDITKPPPARQLEELPAGWGILLDDLAAAIYANLLCQILLRVVWIG